MRFPRGVFDLSPKSFLENINEVESLTLRSDLGCAEVGDSVVDICARMGSSLRFLKLWGRDMNGEHFRKIRKSCSNALIDVQDLLQSDGIDTDSILAIGEAASFLCTGEDHDFFANLDRDGNTFPNLERFS